MSANGDLEVVNDEVDCSEDDGECIKESNLVGKPNRNDTCTHQYNQSLVSQSNLMYIM